MKFKLSEKFKIDSTEAPWKNEGLRSGFFGAPGSGKSYTAATVIEQFLDQGGTVVIFQPRAEWHTLKSKYGQVQVVGGPFNMDVPFVASEPRLYADAVVYQGVSMIFYTGDVDDEGDLIDFVSKFISHLLRLEEKAKRPILLVLEETQEYAPKNSSGHIAPPWIYNRMIKQFKDCFTQGRKLNVSPMAISQRPQEVNFTIRQLCNLTFYGKFNPQDIAYIDKECLKPYREKGLTVKANTLLDLEPGSWLAIHGSMAEIVDVTVKRSTPHGADTPTLEYVAKADEQVEKMISDLGMKLQAMLDKRKAEESEIEKSKRRVRDMEKEIADLREKANIAGVLREGFQNGVGKGAKVDWEGERAGYSVQAEAIDRLEESMKAKDEKIYELEQTLQKMIQFGEKIKAIKEIVISADGALVNPSVPVTVSMTASNTDLVKNLPEYEHRIYVFLAAYPNISYSRYQIATGAKVGLKSSRFSLALNRLRKLKLIQEDRNGFKVS